MRRVSDRNQGHRTGEGRRARDRMMAGQTRPSPQLRGRHELANMILFLSDDLRESAVAVGGIEAFLMEAQRVLEKEDVTAEELAAIVDDDRVVERIDLLWDALGSLRRSMGLIHDTLKISGDP